MPVQRNQPSPQRQTVLTFVSPNVQDLLFYETVDAQRVGKTPPEYGTAHPDTVNFLIIFLLTFVKLILMVSFTIISM